MAWIFCAFYISQWILTVIFNYGCLIFSLLNFGVQGALPLGKLPFAKSRLCRGLCK